MGYGIHPYGRVIVNLRVTVDQLPGHDSNIPGRGYMAPGFRQTAAVLKMGGRHAKFPRPPVHHIYKGFLVPRYVLCHGNAGVIA